ncbi:DUF2799 domain-containing protein [Vibrio kyushuensis]|uniref:DUF2799 domain-containing protein n=1 Tax=Vibrio kyushuensis TaxID=2910249 RepID=UPI003D142377
MRYLLVLLTMVLVGCAQLATPDSLLESEWAEFGKQRGEKGYLRHSQPKLEELDQQGILTDTLYAAYDTGYKEGQSEYCSQSAFTLGLSGKPYLGICNKIDTQFDYNYNAGMRAGSFK